MYSVSFKHVWCMVLMTGLLSSTSLVLGQSADPNLVGWWTFDEGSGVDVSDSSGYGNDSGDTTGPLSWTDDGRINGAGQFNGTADFVECLESPSLNPVDAISITLWVNTDTAATGTTMALIMKGEFTYGMRFDDANNLEFWIYSDGFKRVETPIDDSFNGSWHHLAGTYDGQTMSLYIDGELMGSNAVTGPINVNNQYFLNFGRNSQGDTANRWWYNGLLDDVRLYNRGLSQTEIQKLLAPEFASLPVPSDGEPEAWPEVILSWLPGLGIDGHHVYLGTNLSDVQAATVDDPRGVLVGQLAVDVTTFDPEGVLALDQTYYWRVDEVQNGTVFPGEVWQFTVPTGFQVKQVTASASSSHNDEVGPNKTVDGSGLNEAGQHSTNEIDMWLSSNGDPDPWIQFEFDRLYQLYDMMVWNSNSTLEFIFGFGVRMADVEYSQDGVTWTALNNVPEFAQAPGSPEYTADTVVSFDGVLAQYVRIVPTSSWSGLPQYGLSEVRFFYLPTHAMEPRPLSDAVVEGLDFLFDWRPGRGAVEHDLYASSDVNAVWDESAFVARIQDSQYDSTGVDLAYGTTFYWKVNEVNEAADPPVVEGTVWSFSILDYFVVDNFESYGNAPAAIRPYVTWRDGLDFSNPAPGGVGNGTGSIVGHDIFTVASPYFGGDIMETDPNIVLSGAQSMPVYYDNSGANGKAMYSEIVRTFDSPQDWQRGTPDTLTLNVYGDPSNAAQPFYVALEDGSGAASKSLVFHPDGATLLQPEAAEWQAWDVALSEFDSVDLSRVTKLYIGVGNPDAPQSGGSGVFDLDDIRVSKAIADE